MDRKRAVELREFAMPPERYAVMVMCDDLVELCDWYLATTPKPAPKVRPEEQIGVPVRMADADLSAKAPNGLYLYRRGWGSWTPTPNVMDTHVMYVKGAA